MLPNCMRKLVQRYRNSASAAKHHTPQLVSETFNFLGIGSGSKPFGQIEELALLALLRFDTLLHQFDQHSSCAQPTSLRHATDLLCQINREADTLPDNFLTCSHNTTVSQHTSFDSEARHLRFISDEQHTIRDRRIIPSLARHTVKTA